MDLKVEWTSAHYTSIEKWQVEREYENFLIDHFGSAEEAFACKQEFHIYCESPRHAWNIANVKAHMLATRNMLPSEKISATFKVSFME